MGVKGLLPFLRARAPQVAQPWTPPDVPLRVAVDAPIQVYKFLHADGGMSAPRLWARFEALLARMAADRLQPTFVFDGAPLNLKDEEHARRARAAEEQALRVDRKRSRAQAEAGEAVGGAVEVVARGPPPPLRVTRADYDDLWARLVERGVPCLRARHEAEALCVHLVFEGAVDAVVTEDSDVLAYHAPLAIFRYGSEPYSIAAPAVHAALGLSAPEFQAFCILLGTDFSARITGVGPVAALALVRGRTAAQALQHLRDGGGGREDECTRALAALPAVQELFATRCWEASIDAAARETVCSISI